MAKQLEENINKKLNREAYEKDIEKIKDKVSLIFNITGEKC